jgi:hypothetical protein
MPAATAAAEPPEEPPGVHVGFHGLAVGPIAECSVEDPMANSSMLVLPTTTAPAAPSFSTTVALKGETYPSRIGDAQVVTSSRIAMLSLIATGMPSRGERTQPASRRASAAAASARAPSSRSRMKAHREPCFDFARARAASVRSRALCCPASRAARSAATVAFAT